MDILKSIEHEQMKNKIQKVSLPSVRAHSHVPASSQYPWHN